jgi:hypothetical protein
MGRGYTLSQVVHMTRRSDDLDRLEELVSEFVSTSKDMLKQDHEKVNLVYDFLFLGQPQAEPPVPPFVAQVQNSLINQSKEIDGIKSVAGKLIWSLVGLAIGGAGWFVLTTITHILGIK